MEQILRGNCFEICNKLDPKDVTNILRKHMTPRVYEEISAKETKHSASEDLLNWLIKNINLYNHFLEALLKSKQNDLHLFLKEKEKEAELTRTNDSSTTVAEILPIASAMNQKHSKKLTAAYDDLRCNMNANTLVPYIYSQDEMNKNERDEIEEHRLLCDRNAALLKWLERQPDKTYLIFCDALYGRKQRHFLRQLLDEEEIIARGFEGISIEDQPPDAIADKFYSMKYKKNGVMLCFLMYNFENSKDLYHSEADQTNLEMCALTLGYEFFPYNNKTKEEVKKIIQEYAKKDFSDCAHLMVVVSTHGLEHDYLFAVDSNRKILKTLLKLNEDVVMPIYENESLKGKPKIFLIQSCRGAYGNEPKNQMGLKMHEFEVRSLVENNISNQKKEIDVLIIFAAIPGHQTNRTPEGGDLINNFTKVITEQNLPISHIMLEKELDQLMPNPIEYRHLDLSKDIQFCAAK